jgi:phage head maturation protease
MKMITQKLKFADLFPDKAGKLAQRLHIPKDEIPFLRKFYTSEKAEVKKDERAVISYISTVDKDRDNEQLMPDGVDLENYRKNPVVLYGHQYSSLPIGKNIWIKQDDRGLIAKTVFAKTEFADQLYNAYTEDVGGTGPLLKAWSVGFIPKKWRDKEEKDAEDSPNRIYTEWELLEYSAVPIPSCPSALTLAVEKGLIPEQLKKDMEIEIEIDDFQDEPILVDDVLAQIDEEKAEKDPDVEITEDEEEDVEIVNKPETTESYHKIPVSTGHDDHKIRTMTVSAKKGIKALYCVDCKKIITYLFDVDKWTMEEAQAWVKENKRNLEILEDELVIEDVVNEIIEAGIDDPECLVFDEDEAEIKRFDLEGNPSVHDIMDAISLTVRPPVNSKIWRYVADLYPVNYPDGHVVIEESSEQAERKYFLRSYEYNGGKIEFGETQELEAAYRPKKRSAYSGEIEKAISDLRNDLIEFKEGRVLSTANRKLVKDTIDALDALKQQLEDLYNATEPPQREGESRDIEIAIEKSGDKKEDIQTAVKEALMQMDIGEVLKGLIKEGVSLEVDRLRGKVR